MVDFSLHGHVALLIDADNVPLSSYDQILKIAEYYGRLEICKAFRKWEDLKESQIKILDDLKIERAQVDQIGPNATDYALSKGVGEILRDEIYTNQQLDTFVIVSGDGGFTMTCHLLQGNNKKIIGIGVRGSTSEILQKSCDEYHHREDLSDELSKLEERYPIPPSEVRKFYNLFGSAYARIRTRTKDWVLENWVSHADVGRKLRELSPDYEMNFGKYKLSQWLESINSIFESNGQQVRAIQDLDYAHYHLLVTAYLNTQQPDHRVHLKQLFEEIYTLCPDYKSRFSIKTLPEWLEGRDNFKIQGDYLAESWG